VIGVDISEKMLAEAREKTQHSNVSYVHIPIEDYAYPENSFDVVISSLTFHYIKSFDVICAKVNRCLADGGDFVFSVEHPIFTAQGKQDWVYDESGTILHWPVDGYFSEGERIARFLDEDVTKYHKTLTTYIECLLRHGFEITGLCEPTPMEELLAVPGMSDELRRPMMLIISAKKR
jgi:ubiquinone/menaquinone biosynthesis C-methylase UbiE